ATMCESPYCSTRTGSPPLLARSIACWKCANACPGGTGPGTSWSETSPCGVTSGGLELVSERGAGLLSERPTPPDGMPPPPPPSPRTYSRTALPYLLIHLYWLLSSPGFAATFPPFPKYSLGRPWTAHRTHKW